MVLHISASPFVKSFCPDPQWHQQPLHFRDSRPSLPLANPSTRTRYLVQVSAGIKIDTAVEGWTSIFISLKSGLCATRRSTPSGRPLHAEQLFPEEQNTGRPRVSSGFIPHRFGDRRAGVMRRHTGQQKGIVIAHVLGGIEKLLAGGGGHRLDVVRDTSDLIGVEGFPVPADLGIEGIDRRQELSIPAVSPPDPLPYPEFTSSSRLLQRPRRP